jgi:nucleotide-binding universal stress UspA family protein
VTEPLEEFHLHRLLVAVDGSEPSQLAVRAAVTAARNEHATVTLISVVPDVARDMSRFAAVAGVAPPSQEEVDETASRLLRETAGRMPDDLPVTTILRRGKAGPKIVAEAASEAYDGILIGARGVGRVAALIGSVSSYVLRHAPATVIVIHGPRATEAP